MDKWKVLKAIIIVGIVYIVFIGVMQIGRGKREVLEKAESAINNIGVVTLNSKAAIEEARVLVSSLSEDDVQKLSNLAILVEAENSYKVLREVAEEQAEQDKADRVIELINSLGKISLQSEDAIKQAESEYGKLSSRAKKLVLNLDILAEAEEKYNELLENAYNEALSRTSVSEDEVKRITYYEPKRMPKYRNERCSLCAYVGTRESEVQLIISYNYAGSNWVFFTNVIIAVDEDRYTKTFDYFEVSRDTGIGKVGEWIQEKANSTDIAILKAISESDRTIVRFEGNDHYHDYTMTNEDKDALADILIIYKYLCSK